MAFETDNTDAAVERFDLNFIHLWGDWSWCRVCHQSVWLGEPERFGSLLALEHWLMCG